MRVSSTCDRPSLRYRWDALRPALAWSISASGPGGWGRGVNVATYRNDNARTGRNTQERTLSEVRFLPLQQHQRPGLLLAQGVGGDTLYVGWASHTDWTPYHGRVMGFDAKGHRADARAGGPGPHDLQDADRVRPGGLRADLPA